MPRAANNVEAIKPARRFRLRDIGGVDSALEELRTQIARDRFSADCRNALTGLDLRELSSGQWSQALDALVAIFIDLPSDSGEYRHRNLMMASHLIETLFLSGYTSGRDYESVGKQMQPYFGWLSLQPDYFLLQTLWKVYEPAAKAHAEAWRTWHHYLAASGRLAKGFGAESLESGIALKYEGDQILFWGEKRWRAWEWQRDILQYKALLADESPVVRAGSAYVIGRIYSGIQENQGANAVPSLSEMLLWFQSEEWRGAGVAGAFLSGLGFPINLDLTCELRNDFREWMFRTMAAGPEPEFTGFQSLSFYAHEFLEATEENLKRLVFMGREDAALMLATEEFGHDPSAERQFRRRFQEWRARTLG